MMVRIFMTEEAFEAIKATLPVGSVAFEPEVTKGLRQIWLARGRQGARPAPANADSDVILRIAAESVLRSSAAGHKVLTARLG